MSIPVSCQALTLLLNGANLKVMNLLTTKEVAKILRISERTVFRYIASKKLKVIRISKGHIVRIEEKDLKTFIKKNKK